MTVNQCPGEISQRKGGARVGAGRVKGGNEKLRKRIKESVFHPCLSDSV